MLPVDGERLREFTRVLQKYKAGKASIERRTIAAENWWKLRNQAEERKSTSRAWRPTGTRPKTTERTRITTGWWS